MFHHDFYIADIIENIKVSKTKFAETMGITVEKLNELLEENADILNDLVKIIYINGNKY